MGGRRRWARVRTYHGDADVQHTAVPEEVRPGAFRGHHAGVALLPLGSDLVGGQGRAIVLRQGVLLPEPRAMGRRVEFERLLEHNGFAAPVLAGCVRLVAAGREAEEEVLRGLDAGSAPKGALQREQEARDDGSRRHCSVVRLLPVRRRWVLKAYPDREKDLDALSRCTTSAHSKWGGLHKQLIKAKAFAGSRAFPEAEFPEHRQPTTAHQPTSPRHPNSPGKAEDEAWLCNSVRVIGQLSSSHCGANTKATHTYPGHWAISMLS